MPHTMDKHGTCALCQCQIKENTLFTGLNDSQLEAFKDVVVVSRRTKRETIFMEGDECRGLYIIRKGRVKVVRSSSSGKEQIIKILSPGDLLGFEIFYDAKTYGNTGVAMEDSELCYVDRRAFFRILEREPDIARKLILSLGMELNQAYERIGSLGLLNAREKLAHLLYTLAVEYGVKSGGTVKLNLTLSRLEIAELLGITQETSIRLLKGFKEEGILDIKRKEIIIKSLAKLKSIGE
ncbi:MAG: Crp/Fnr family transcriptional regulator [Deltaproteobacteria bacterium]|nr:Crp/Fnr family transcriptional regulator [Deltaproteobacteria bacterium]